MVVHSSTRYQSRESRSESERMPVISIARAKGGCGKTTTGILLGAELALNHTYRVALLDSDVNQHATAFGKKARIPNLTIIAAMNELNVLSALREAEEKT